MICCMTNRKLRLQVFEWCHYLVFSKLEKRDSTIITSGVANIGVLQPEHLEELHAHYKLTNLQYTSILDEYNRAHIRASNSRNKSQFPDKQLWNPPGKFLTEDERILLLGPSSDIVYYRKLLLCDANTKRMIHFSSKTPEAKVIHH